MASATPDAAAWPLLDESRLRTLMCWAPSHERKFSAMSVAHPVDGWTNVFPKERSIAALLNLLRRDGGVAAAEAICRRASVRGPAEAVARAASTAFAGHARNPRQTPRSRWAYELAALGSPVEAAWLLWLERASSKAPPPFPSWAAQNPALETLIEPRSPTTARTTTTADDSISTSSPDTAAPVPDEVRQSTRASQPDHGSVSSEASRKDELVLPQQSEDLVAELRRMLAAPDLDPIVLPHALRDAAHRIEIAIAAAGLAEELETRDRLAAELDGHLEALVAVGDAFGGAPAHALAAMRSSLADCPLPAARLMVDGARDYAEAALRWRAALDRLPSTHDYAGAADLREAAVAAARALNAQTGSQTGSIDGQASTPVGGEVGEPTRADNAIAASVGTADTPPEPACEDGSNLGAGSERQNAASLLLADEADHAKLRSGGEHADLDSSGIGAPHAGDAADMHSPALLAVELTGAMSPTAGAPEHKDGDASEPMADRGTYTDVAYAAPPSAPTQLPASGDPRRGLCP